MKFPFVPLDHYKSPWISFIELKGDVQKFLQLSRDYLRIELRIPSRISEDNIRLPNSFFAGFC